MPNEPNPTSGTPGCIVLKNQEITPNTMANKQRKRLGSFAPPAPSLRGGEMGRQPAAVLRTGRTLPEAAPEPSRPRPGAPPFDPRQPLLDRLGGRKDVPGALHRRPRPRRETKPGPSVHMAASREGPGQIQNQNAPNEANLPFVFNTRRKKRTQSARRAPLLLDNPFAALLIFWQVLIS
jgi:hypothetical protein